MPTEMTNLVKYPRTMHLPWSPGLQNDDRVIDNLNGFIGEEVVVTEKMDGENTTMHDHTIHARSVDGRHHPSRDWVKRFWAENVAYRLPEYARICGENLYARHSIEYDDLESYFYGFGLWVNDQCAGWDDTVSLFRLRDVTPVPELWRGEFNEKVLHDIADGLNTTKQEGFVVRVVRSFTMDEFPSVVAKWVRKGHVQTDKHWMHSEIVPNKLKETE